MSFPDYFLFSVGCFFEQLVKGLGYLHLHRIIYGDMKPENVLVTFPPEHHHCAKGRQEEMLFYTLKICDFGSAKAVPLSDTRNNDAEVQRRGKKSTAQNTSMQDA